MNPTAMVLRWYRQSTSGANTHQHQYTTEEVLQLLRPDDCTADRSADQPDGRADGRPDEGQAVRGAAVRQIAAQPSAWLAHVTKQHRMEIGALADRLPTLLFHHTAGGEPGDLMQRFGGWSTWRYERALEVAGACIASCLNQRRLVA